MRVDPTLERVRELTDLVLTWLSGMTYPEGKMLPRRHASIEGKCAGRLLPTGTAG